MTILRLQAFEVTLLSVTDGVLNLGVLLDRSGHDHDRELNGKRLPATSSSGGKTTGKRREIADRG